MGEQLSAPAARFSCRLYVGLPMALLIALRSMGGGNWGLAALITTIAVTKSTDAGAYFSGKALGKHKLIPRLSPGKTREGAVGGILTATIVAFVCLQWLFPAIAGAAAGSGFDALGRWNRPTTLGGSDPWADCWRSRE